MSLYEDRTYENLMEESLEDLAQRVPELPENYRNIDSQEGSLIWLALSKGARRLEEVYDELENLNDNMLVDTQEEEYLVESGVECGIPIREGTTAVVRAELNCPCEIGDEFSAIDSDYNYICVHLIEVINDDEGNPVYCYEFESDEEGVDPGSYHGDVEPIDFLEDFETGVITECLIPGTEREDIEEYRERRLNTFISKACAGNRAYYLEVINAIGGVGGVKVKRRQEGQNHIDCWVIDSEYNVPSEGLLRTIKETVDPEDNEGEGLGLAPFGHILHVNSVDSVECNIAAKMTFYDDYSFETLTTAIRDAIDNYLFRFREGWEDSSRAVVRISGIESAILAVEGVIDVADATINGEAVNLTLTEYEIPTLGTVEEVLDG